jgi:LysR family transcriptional regulator for metE and metH
MAPLPVTPDPNEKKTILFHKVFDYELVLVIAKDHHLVTKPFVEAEDLQQETLVTYPVEQSRLDIYRQFLMPASSMPMRHRMVESTDIMLEMVASKRGVTAMPSWLIEDYKEKIPLHSLPLGKKGIFKSLYLGIRRGEIPAYLTAFIDLAKSVQQQNWG